MMFLNETIPQNIAYSEVTKIQGLKTEWQQEIGCDPIGCSAAGKRLRHIRRVPTEGEGGTDILRLGVSGKG